MRDAVFRHWRFAVAILLTSIANTASKIGAIWVIFNFATKASENQSIIIFGQEYDPRQSMIPLILAALVSATLFLLSALFGYAERRLTYASWGAHAELCATRALSALKDPSITNQETNPFANPNAFQRLVNGHANTTGRVLSIALGSVSPLITLLIAIGIMLWISPVMTFILATLMALLIPAHALVSVRAAKASEISTNLAGAHADAIRHFAAPFFASQEPPSDTEAQVQSMYTSGPIRDYRDAYIKRFRCFAESELLIGITAAASILILVIGMGWWSLSHEGGWSVLLIYFVTLRFAFGSVGSLTKRIASINRFYPEVSSYHTFDRLRRGLSIPPIQTSSAAPSVSNNLEDDDLNL